MVRIIGIDPGLAQYRLGRHRAGRRSGSPMWRMAACIPMPTRGWRSGCCRSTRSCWRCCVQYAPDEAAIEETFVNKDARATLKLGQARGVVMLAPAIAGHSGRRICAECDQEIGGGRGPCRKGPGQAHGETAAAAGPNEDSGFDRCAGHRHLPCPSPGHPDLAATVARS